MAPESLHAKLDCINHKLDELLTHTKTKGLHEFKEICMPTGLSAHICLMMCICLCHLVLMSTFDQLLKSSLPLQEFHALLVDSVRRLLLPAQDALFATQAMPAV